MMDKIRNLFPEEIIEAFGWTLFHSIWQITVIAIVLVLLLVLLKSFSARIKYTMAFLALVSCLAWSVTTWYSSYHSAVQKKEMKESLLNNPEAIKLLLKEKIVSQAQVTSSGQVPLNLDRLKLKSSIKRFMPLVFFIWLAGVLFFLLRMTGGMVYILQLRNRHVVEIENKWHEKISDYIRKLKINRKIGVLQSAVAKVPMVVGFIKPVVLLPASILSGLGSKEIEAIIAHELAHIKRNDYLFNIIQSVIETLFFYHPALWVISKSIRNERENSCDDLALKITRDKLSYIKALAASQSLFTPSTARAVAFASKGGLLNRVKRIQNHTFMKRNGYEGFIAASLVFISIVLLSFTIDRSNPKDDEYFAERNNHEQPVPADTIKPKRAHKIKVIKAKKADNDSLDIIVEKITEDLDEIPEEIEHLIEIAYTTSDDSLVKVICHTFEYATKELDDSLFAFDFDMKDIDVNMEDFDEQMKDFDIQMKDFDIRMKDFDIKMKSYDSVTANFNYIFKDDDRKVMVYTFNGDNDSLNYHFDYSFDKIEALKEAELALKEINIDSIIAAAKKDAEFFKNPEDFGAVIKHTEDLKGLQKEEIEKIIEDAMKAIEEADLENSKRKFIIHKEFEEYEEEESKRNKEAEAGMEEELKKLEESN
jgi:beta-lactamase regulating signal transducer with metallopeptidase domain